MTDRPQIVAISLAVGDFIENVAKKTSDLTAHFFISKSQSQYLKCRKELLGENAGIVLLDFAENYQLDFAETNQCLWTRRQHVATSFFSS